MRVTNNMIMRNSSYNINGTKGIVDAAMNQMTTQKKINRPSDDPVVAIRSLRLSTSLSRVDQYYKKNIPDAQSWLDVTETALTNIKSLMTDIRTQCVNGATDTLTQDDRNTILSQLKALQSQVFSEGNADYAGRTVFTGYRTDKELVFSENEKDTQYEIHQKISWEEMEEFRYYDGDLKVPSSATEVNDATALQTTDTVKHDYDRMRVGYKDIESVEKISYGSKTIDMSTATDILDADGNVIGKKSGNLTVYETAKDWSATDQKVVDDDDIVFIQETGELIFGKNVASEIQAGKMDLSIDYTKKGFNKGELRPEYYYNCKDTTSPNPDNHIVFEKFDKDGQEIGYDINFTVSMNQELTVNLEASDAFNGDVQRDVDDLILAMDRAIAAHDKLEKIKSMIDDTQYADETSQANLKKWKELAQKEVDYADDHVQELYSSEIGKMDKYLGNVNLAITKVGCTVDQLKLTETRMNNQEETIMELQSTNDDLDLSEIIIKYTASYNAYQSSLTAAGKLSGMTLLNYI